MLEFIMVTKKAQEMSKFIIVMKLFFQYRL